VKPLPYFKHGQLITAKVLNALVRRINYLEKKAARKTQ